MKSRRLWRLQTKISMEGGNPVFFVGGRLDHASKAELEALTANHERSSPERVIIDLSEVDYISSSALTTFQAIAHRQEEKGGRLVLRAPSTAARLALDLAGMLPLVDG